MASEAQVLEFLQDRLDKGLTPNTIKRQVAALSSVLSLGKLESLSRDPTVHQFLRGATNLCSPVVHRYLTWDLSKVLQALTGSPFEPLRSATLCFLTLKITFLIPITSARRISELAALSVRQNLCIFHQDRVVLRLDPSFIPKVNTWFHRAQELVLPNFCPEPRHALEHRWHILNVRRAYLHQICTCLSEDGIFVCFIPTINIGQQSHSFNSGMVDYSLHSQDM